MHTCRAASVADCTHTAARRSPTPFALPSIPALARGAPRRVAHGISCPPLISMTWPVMLPDISPEAR
jgi:hypothetical protein